ncbi:MAG: elongation factor Ts [Planctomycetes bacterium]|nr:elongation factor Ts [Planctomycetota bacterium]
MECKRALSECEGDGAKAVEYLRKRGVAQAAKKASRATSQGWIGQYVHSNGKIGVLVEVMCETDFVAKNEQFQQLIRDLSMHIAWANPIALRREDLDPALIAKERDMLLESHAIAKEPPDARNKLVESKIEQFIASKCLLLQPFVKDEKKTIQDLLVEKIATIGENITIGRFMRLELGAQ